MVVKIKKIMKYCIAFATIVILVGCQNKAQNMQKLLEDIGIYIETLDNFSVDSKDNNKVIAHRDDIIFMLTVFSGLDNLLFKKYINEKAAMIESLYEIRGAPYPGEITQEIICPEEFKPVKNKVQNNFSLGNYVLFASKRLTYGVCAKDLANYKSFIGYFNCNNDKLFQIEFFVPVDRQAEFENMLDAIANLKCK